MQPEPTAANWDSAKLIDFGLATPRPGFERIREPRWIREFESVLADGSQIFPDPIT